MTTWATSNDGITTTSFFRYVEGLSYKKGNLLAQDAILYAALSDRFTRGQISIFHIYENGYTKLESENVLDVYLESFKFHQTRGYSALYFVVPSYDVTLINDMSIEWLCKLGW